MMDPNWLGFEVFFDEYMKKNFVQGSVRRETEFATIWEAASQEGGKDYLKQFISQLEAEAQKV
jgi:hypothetical protein